MMNWSDGSIRAMELQLREWRTWAERERLVRQARRARPQPAPRRWRRHIGRALIAAGEALIEAAPDLARRPTCHPPLPSWTSVEANRPRDAGSGY